MIARTTRKDMDTRPIYVTRLAAMRLRALLLRKNDALRDQAHLRKLRAQIERAIVMEPCAMPPEVITMGSRVLVRDLTTGVRSQYTLVFPEKADMAARRLSILEPLGAALLSYRQRDEIECEMPAGARRLRVEFISPDWESAAAQLLPIGSSRMPSFVYR